MFLCLERRKKNVSQVSYSAILIYRHNSEKNLKIKIKTPLNLYELLIGRSLAQDVWVWKASFTDSTSNSFFLKRNLTKLAVKNGPKDIKVLRF